MKFVFESVFGEGLATPKPQSEIGLVSMSIAECTQLIEVAMYGQKDGDRRPSLAGWRPLLGWRPSLDIASRLSVTVTRHGVPYSFMRLKLLFYIEDRRSQPGLAIEAPEGPSLGRIVIDMGKVHRGTCKMCGVLAVYRPQKAFSYHSTFATMSNK